MMCDTLMVAESITEAKSNPDFAVKQSCMSLLLESWSIEPHIISPVTEKDVIRGVKNRSVRDEILRIIRLGATEKDKVFRISILS